MSFIYFSIMKTWCWIGSDYDLFREEMIYVWYYYFFFPKTSIATADLVSKHKDT